MRDYNKSMQFKIRHDMFYRYSAPVFLEPLVIRLQPRSDCHQKLHDYHLHVMPTPTVRTDAIDVDGNSTSVVWFNGRHREMTITVSSTVETQVVNSVDFCMTDDGLALMPVSYCQPLAKSLWAYTDSSAVDPTVRDFAGVVAERVGYRTLPFLSELSSEIHRGFKWSFREKGDPYPSAVTLAMRQGACRDFTVLFLDCCRVMGLAARFVSGYLPGQNDTHTRNLHAWAEVYLPGGGWRGFDPTHGGVVDAHHVALAAAAHPQLGAPTFGTFLGDNVESTFNFELSIETLDGYA